MVSQTSLQFVRISALLALTVTAPHARADEAFLCGPDTVIYVAPDQLELKKRSDPCIAGHFGLTVEAPAPIAGHSPPVAVKAAPKPVTKSYAASPARAALRRLDDKDAASAPVAARFAALEALPKPAPETDYRNVRVLNPATQAERWFHHDK